MNTYNENLAGTVSSLLQGQELHIKALDSQYQTARYSCYYAHGAVATAKIRLAAAEQDLRSKSLVKHQSQLATDAALNLETSAYAADQYVKASVAASAVAAANVQIATSAMVRLAGDIGGINALVTAADYGSDIWKLTQELTALINDTAFEAERVSQLAMEMSALTAEVAAATVANEAKQTAASAAQLLTLASADAEAAGKQWASGEATVAAAASAAYKSEAERQRLEKEYRAAVTAYSAANKSLNLDLTVAVTGPHTVVVEFDAIKHPFKKSAIADHYVVILVKENRKWTFSAATAESIAAAGNIRQSVKITPGTEGRIRQQIETAEFQDADGEAVRPGIRYAAFVLAVYSPDYKKTINSFDDLLSAPSETFTLTTPVSAVNADTLQVAPQHDGTRRLSFRAEKPMKHVAYRCILLPEPVFFFDVELAEQVSAANYTVPRADPSDAGQYHAVIDPDTTDCFGDRLVEGRRYKPVVMTMADVKPEDTAAYTNALSDTAKATSFTY